MQLQFSGTARKKRISGPNANAAPKKSGNTTLLAHRRVRHRPWRWWWSRQTYAGLKGTSAASSLMHDCEHMRVIGSPSMIHRRRAKQRSCVYHQPRSLSNHRRGRRAPGHKGHRGRGHRVLEAALFLFPESRAAVSRAPHEALSQQSEKLRVQKSVLGHKGHRGPGRRARKVRKARDLCHHLQA